jgi:hypothetical protein
MAAGSDGGPYETTAAGWLLFTIFYLFIFFLFFMAFPSHM